MIKSPHHLILMICTVLILSACANTQSKDSATNKTDLWGDLSIDSSNESLVKPNLTGTWVLNTDLSENPQEDLKESSIRLGMRINPEYSEIEVELYNPCAKNSRLGVTSKLTAIFI